MSPAPPPSSTTNDEDGEILHVAIAGAGIAGLTTAIALSKHPRIDVQLYDKASALREIGASIAIGPNGLRTLEKLGVTNALEEGEACFRGPSGWPMIYRHWQTNEIVSHDEFKNVPERRHQTARFARAHLHQALLEHVAAERIHLGKKIVAVEEEQPGSGGGRVVLKFADGSEAAADLVVGADGINSGVRKFFLPDSKIGPTTQVAYRAVFDASLVEDIPDLPEDSTHWWGPNGSVFASRLGKNQYTTVSIHPLPPTSPHVDWNTPTPLAPLLAHHATWHPLIRTLFARTPPSALRAYPNRALVAPLPTHSFLGGRVVLVGDAAHPHGGAFASGGGLAVDDAWALARAVIWGVFEGGGGLERAAGVYERVRGGHTGRLLEVVRVGEERAKERVGRGESDQELRKRMEGRADAAWLHECDVEGEFWKVVGGRRRVGGGRRRGCRGWLGEERGGGQAV